MEEKDTNLEESSEQIKDEVVNDEAKSLASEENSDVKNEKSEPLFVIRFSFGFRGQNDNSWLLR